MDMVGVVARALLEADVVATAADDPSLTEAAVRAEADKLLDTFYVELARAAFRAIREPTEAMVAKGNQHCPLGGAETYRAMIDAALATPQGRER